MGLDVLDILFRTERAFGVTLNQREVARLFTGRQPADVTAGQWCDFVLAAYLKRPAARRHCDRCGYPRFGLPAREPCPECGQPSLEDPAQAWRRIREILHDSIGCEIDAIHRDSLLRKDLGAGM